ncbi:hypothetical protein GCM10027614_01140 [Micromonospora vulcania]
MLPGPPLGKNRSTSSGSSALSKISNQFECGRPTRSASSTAGTAVLAVDGTGRFKRAANSTSADWIWAGRSAGIHQIRSKSC